jgi:prepilin signal peptidase PulO-like enzyme (type II secretory pathway)
MIELFIFALGLIIGSFLNCVIWRLSQNEGFLFGSSYCPHCKHSLDFFDLFPVLSFLFLRGKCRYCKKNISWQYPIVELITGFLFLLVYSNFGPLGVVFSYDFFQLLFWLIIISIFVIIFIFDLKYYIIPDEVTYPAIFISLAWIFYSFFVGAISDTQTLYYILSALCASGFFFLIWFLSKGKAMGFGDVKLAIFLGLILGWPNIVVGLFLAFFFGAIIGIILVFLKKKGFKSEVPFGPFLVAGTMLAAFWGDKILNWYFSLMV